MKLHLHSSKFLDNLVLTSTYGQICLTAATKDDDDDDNNNNKNDNDNNDDDDDDNDDDNDNAYGDSDFFFKIMSMLLTVTAALHISSVVGQKVCGELYF